MEGEENQNQPETPVEGTSKSESPKSSNTMLPIVLIVLVLIFGGAYYFKMKNGSPVISPAALPTATATTSSDTTTPTTSTDTTTNNETATDVPNGPVKEFTINGANYKFDPATITVKQGDTVKITFNDNDGMHDLVISGYDVQTDIINSGSTAELTFTADQKGTFEYYCSVDSHREKGMTGKLIVQ